MKNLKILAIITIVSLVSACSNPTQTPSTSTSPSPSSSSAPGGEKDLAKLGDKSAVKLIDFTWKKYNLKFTLPSTLKEATNQDGEFEASNESMNFQVFPWKDAKATKDDVLVQAFKGLTGIDKASYVIDETASGEIENLNGFKGYVVLGEAKQGGTPVYLGILALIDPNGSDNFISYLVFDKAKGADDIKNINVGADIFLSFKKN
ncbi:MAG: hypothetical protein U0457_07205 [Candidatus Sericytochromatia bacterium]